MTWLPGMDPGHRREGDDEWYTPPDILEAVRLALVDHPGHMIDLDPCSAPNSFVPADVRYLGGGLTEPWFGTVFCNPPYSDVSPWLLRCASHHQTTGNNVVALLPARAEIDAWHRFVWPTATTLFFPKGRIRFVKPDGGTAGSGKTTPVFVCWGANVGEVLQSMYPGDGALVGVLR